MRANLRKHIFTRLTISAGLLLLHLVQLNGEVGIDETANTTLGTTFLLVWLGCMGVETVVQLNKKQVWLAVSNITMMALTAMVLFFLQVLVALACC